VRLAPGKSVPGYPRHRLFAKLVRLFHGRDDHGGRAVVQTGGITGSDRAGLPVERGLQRRQALHGDVPSGVLVGGEHLRIALALGHRHGDDFVLEFSAVDRGDRLLVALVCYLVLVLARYVVFFR